MIGYSWVSSDGDFGVRDLDGVIELRGSRFGETTDDFRFAHLGPAEARALGFALLDAATPWVVQPFRRPDGLDRSNDLQYFAEVFSAELDRKDPS